MGGHRGWVFAALLWSACNESVELDAGDDAALRDAGPEADAGSDPDAGMDAGMLDAGMSDAGMSDAGMSDAGMDAGMSDAGMDAGMSDAGTDAGMPDAGVDLCGNGMLDPGEMCDDGAAPGGCDACRLAPYCGDGLMGGAEICDDGNQRSGDGCRSDCLSNETCGNGIVDAAAGEVCDSTVDCDPAMCAFITGCGNGGVSPPEICDDSNRARWDGCDSACNREYALVIDSFRLAPAAGGCDLDGDGSNDNAFASGAFGLFAVSFGQFLSMAVQNGQLSLLLGFIGLDDRFLADDADFGLAWLQGIDADGNPANDFSGSNAFFVATESLDVDGTPINVLQSAVAARALSGGPGDIALPLGALPFDLQAARVQGTSSSDLASVFRIDGGLLCGGLPLSWLAVLGGLTGGTFETMPACDGGAPASFLDLVIAGGDATIVSGGMRLPISFPGARPDLDLDRDGLEDFVVTSGASCQAVVSSCVDGDGTVIAGRDCMTNPAIGDGYSSAFDFSAVRAELVGAI